MSTENSEKNTESELETLKNRADLMGISYRPNIGVDRLREKVNKQLSEDNNEAPKEILLDKNGIPENAISHKQFLKEKESSVRKELNKLIRVRVTCMNPNKKAWEGEIISVGNAKYGTYKKYVPFNTEEGWHIPKVIYDTLKDRKFTVYSNVKTAKGQKIRKGKLVPEFSIEVLPPLTDVEIKELARKQALATAGSD